MYLSKIKNIKLMKINNIKIYFIVLFLIFQVHNLMAQTSTYILIRHAEKDTSQAGSTMMQSDPPLALLGQERALRLVKQLEGYSPGIIYSTNFTRTKSTVAPLCKVWHTEPIIYDHKKLDVFAADLLALQNKTVVVVGHSNTTPALVNLLIKEKKFESLDESVYNKIFIVKFIDNKYVINVIEY